jgi:anti-sigma factor RsiW
LLRSTIIALLASGFAGILYYLSDAKLKITYPDGKTEVREAKSGTAVWSEAVTHAVENVGLTELHEVHTELKGQP